MPDSRPPYWSVAQAMLQYGILSPELAADVKDGSLVKE